MAEEKKAHEKAAHEKAAEKAAADKAAGGQSPENETMNEPSGNPTTTGEQIQSEEARAAVAHDAEAGGPPIVEQDIVPAVRLADNGQLVQEKQIKTR